MNLTRSSNPVLSKNVFENARAQMAGAEVMTINGTLNKTVLMLLFVLSSAFFTWSRFFDAYNPGNPLPALNAVKTYMLIGGIGGFIVAIFTSFSPTRAAFLTPIYAILQGMFLGGLSATFEAQFPGMVIRAVALTFAVFLGMLLIYRQRIIKVDGKFRKGMMAALFGLMAVYVVSWIAGMFGVHFGFMHGTGNAALIFSMVVVGIAAFTLLLDFDFVEQGAKAGAPKYMEWYGVFGLLVSLIWLYINILRLLSIIARRD